MITEASLNPDGSATLTITLSPAQVRAAIAGAHGQNPRAGARRFGKYERHVLGVFERKFDSPAIRCAPHRFFVDTCVRELPRPAHGRDIRRQSVQRAIQSLTKGKDAPLKYDGKGALVRAPQAEFADDLV